MKKTIIALSAIAAISTSSFAANVSTAEMMKQIEALKAQIEALENKLGATETTTKANKESLEKMMNSDSITVNDARFKKLEKKVDSIGKTATDAKIQSGGDNLKWDVDFRTQVDNIQYKHVSGKKSKNNALMTNRLWLGMAYQADTNSIFYGTLSYNKAFGDTANHSQSNTNPGYADFDWVTNENATDNTVKVKEAYWLYKNDSFLGNKDVSWTASVGRRPSTDGLGINLRADQKRKSPLSHTVNVEFDGASARFNLDKVTGIEGMWFKLCAGRGLTNAKARFQMDGTDYSDDDTLNDNVDMLGFIFVPWDNGQYSVHTNYARAWNLIGYTNSQIGAYQSAMKLASSATDYINAQSKLSFNDVGDMDLATIMFKAEGIGDGISDFLDDTTFFASYAMSVTHPTALGMLGTTDSKVGQSFWIGLNMPCPLDPDKARIGIEWNHGTKYWRSMTYGEDTYAGSKIAARGDAWEIYRNQKLTNALEFGLSYLYIDYDYTGSNSFFGAEGTPYDIDSAQAAASDAVKSAQDIKAYIRYRF
ncbi:hypothetical protein CRV08_09110 [Halarcobacter ebronensis]|uniref:DUF3373 domain-containing protein n=1 Tax=Halarcobacter ebronensis TaxID=1462615 RepID=A0A4V1LRE9_9BACT|nr:DUF3373 family protein [Halarcobacter ebronensis]RXJ67958.1 hypothetical protein CRV08_09110 [Halarcobacter ebronensis]